MLVGAPGRSLIERAKVLALLFDELILEAGSLEITLGEQGGLEGPSSNTTWTSGPERACRAAAGDLEIHAADGRLKGRIPLAPARYWRATFAPLLRDVGRGYPWISTGALTLTTEGEHIASDQLRIALGAGTGLSVRDSVLYTSTARDLVGSSGLGAVVSMDRFHQAYVQALVDAGAAAQVTGPAALWIACPKVGSLSWEDIDIARKHRGMNELRSVLAELETTALDSARTGAQLDRAITAGLLDRVIQASHAAGLKTWRGAARRAALSTIVGLTPAGIPYTISAELAAMWRSQGTWLAALSALRVAATRLSE
jgi:hypothetical protein